MVPISNDPTAKGISTFSFPVVLNLGSVVLSTKTVNQARARGVVVNNPDSVRLVNHPVKLYTELHSKGLPVPEFRALSTMMYGERIDITELDNMGYPSVVRGHGHLHYLEGFSDVVELAGRKLNPENYVVFRPLTDAVMAQITATPVLRNRRVYARVGDPLPMENGIITALCSRDLAFRGSPMPAARLLALQVLTELDLDYGTVTVAFAPSGEGMRVENVTTNFQAGDEHVVGLIIGAKKGI